MLFALGEKLLYLFTIHSYLLPQKNSSLGRKVKSEEWRVKSEKVKKYPRNKSEEFFWLGHRDSNPGNDGVRVRCLTAWRCPNIYFTTRIIAENFLFVNRYLQKKIKLFLCFFNFREISLYFCRKICYNIKVSYICPWHSWIARQTPTLKASGSNPLGQAKKKSRASGFSFCTLHSSLFTLLFSLNLSARLFQRREKREERKEKVAFLPLVEKHWFMAGFVLFTLLFSLFSFL